VSALAQFDVYINPSRTGREAIPYVVDVQSNLLNGLPTRFVMPLARPEAVPSKGPKALSPEVEIAGEMVRVLPFLAAAVRPKELGRPVASLKREASVLVHALDAVISGV